LHGLDYVILRIANLYGPYQLARKNQGVVAALMRRALAGEPLEIWGSGEVVRDFVYVTDAVRAILGLAQYSGSARLFNVGSGEGTTINTLVDSIETVMDGGALRRVYRPGRALDVPANVLDIRRINAAIGWRPEVGLLEGLRSTFDWLATQGR
jgi:UDP-glucose 4-epimerase